ncbi:RUN and FYVE domain-containing protein 2-like isoform X1 [Bemisia tabaci]|uniref:RUN and FYVE domain-containing protein 2 isoform X1 n=1 Tax=Bemisia tabaci TaxID=7038 RepID=UPI0008F98ABD|nr:PREDICTED: RUN and FYVE domain-containing protein 2 isoform X1 [Bemisia tabaci]
MAAFGEGLPTGPEGPSKVGFSPTAGEFFFKSASRSPSVTSVERWPQLLVSNSKSDKLSQKVRDPGLIERRNLVNISKLIVKELIETSVKYGRMLDSDSMPLQHFFIVLEHVLRHGLRPKKGLLGPKKELWDILQTVEKLTAEAQDITASVRDLPTVKTAMGRARAWLRLALMQKKLGDYLKVLVDHKDDILSDYYEPDALLMSEEIIVIVGLLLGLNVIDCNLCVKEEDLDCQQGVIDFSLYLRNACPVNCSGSSIENDPDLENMTAVLDQKNYIEELNRHLTATVGNLQAKVEALTTTNALMKEDLEISKSNLYALMEENANLKAKLSSVNSSAHIEETTKGTKDVKDENDPMKKEMEQLKQQLDAEKKQKQDAMKELHLQLCLKNEMEVAMKLLEKDIHDKQDTITSLRCQLDDIKVINIEMYKKLQECENSLKHKTELITKLEAKTVTMSDALEKLDAKYKVCDKERQSAFDTMKQESVQVSKQEGKLKVEQEWRMSLQNSMEKDREKISQLQQENSQLKAVSMKYVTLQEEHFQLQTQFRDLERTLEEVGAQLSMSKLQIEDLKESASQARSDAQWVDDKQASKCHACAREFTLARRKHHCRNCGEIFCNACSDNTMPMPSSAKPERVCDTCHLMLMNRYSVVS